MAKVDLTAQRVRELLHYDPDTGALTWARARRGVPAGAAANHVHCEGYISLTVDNRKYLGHRLAWLHFYGQWPVFQIDHINGVKTDNRLANLRDVSPRENSQNKRHAQSHNLSGGLLGVTSPWSSRGKFQAKITVNGRRLHIGTFLTPDDAHRAYLEAKRRLHPGGTI